MSTKPRADPVEEEEDLDDLDDVISKFTPGSSKAKPAPTSTTTKPPLPIPETPSADLEALDDEFAKELAKGMESLFRELSGVSAAPGSGSEEGNEATEKEKAELKAAWEAMLLESMNGVADPETVAGVKGQDKGKQTDKDKSAGPTDYQSLLREAMKNIHESESNIKKEGGSQFDEENPAALLQQLLSLADKDPDSEDSGQIADLLQSMMDTIISREVLYEPIQELQEKFPPYLKENAAKLSKEETEQYNAQLACITEISGIFEDPKYSDSDPAYRAKIAVLMERLQTLGTPPSELMGPLPGLGEGVPEGCTIS